MSTDGLPVPGARVSGIEVVPEAPFYIPATGPATRPRRTLKRDDTTILNIDLTNPDIYFDKRLVLEKDTLHIDRTVFLWQNTAFQRLALRNYGARAVNLV